MPIIWMVAGLALLAILAKVFHRRIILTVVIGVVLFFGLLYLAATFLGFHTSEPSSVLWFALPAIALALLISRRRRDYDPGPFVAPDTTVPAYETAPPRAQRGPADADLSNDAFLNWLESNGYADQAITPEQMRAYRAVFRKEAGGS